MKLEVGSATDEQLKELFPDLPSGPLDGYRKKASFDWRRIKLAYDTLSTMKLKNDMWAFMHSHPLFHQSVATTTLDEERHIATKRMYTLYNENFVPHDKIVEDPRLSQAETEGYFMLDSSMAVKLALTFKMFTNTILGTGAEKHMHYVEDIQKAKIGGCFALTEVSHGSNAKGMRTTATYLPEKKQFVLHTPDFEAAKCWVGAMGNYIHRYIQYTYGSNAKGMRTTATYLPDKKQFVLHTPDFEAAKCWVGAMGKCATHAIVYAMLISKGKNHGLHAFVVPIRDPRTLKALPGVTVGDIGEKVGLNGIDNGFVMFNNYHLPKDAALDKLGGVDDSGDYQTPFKDPSKRFGASLGVLSGGRVHITSITANYLQKAIVIAIRYSAVRKQFGPEGGDELPVLEYQQQQIRLLPYLAATYALRIFANWFGKTHLELTIKRIMGMDDPPAVAAAKGLEIHALSSAAKPVAGWTARDGIQNCREACGGHGYLKAARIGDLRNDNDANCTYEGENSLLLQQTSNWLLGVWPKRQQLTKDDSPLGTLDFLFNVDTLLSEKCPWTSVKDIVDPYSVWPKRQQLTKDDSPLGTLDFIFNVDKLLSEKCPWTSVKDIVDPYNLVHMFQWLTAFTLRMTADKVASLKSQGKDSFSAKNDSQSFNAATLSVVYGENYILNHFHKTALAMEDERCRNVLLKLVSLYGAFLLEKHMATLYIGGYFRNEQGLLLREGIVSLCARVAPDAVALVDALAPPDWCLNSVLGMADGEVYKHIQSSFLTYPGALERPEWWRDVVFWDSYVPSKL